MITMAERRMFAKAIIDSDTFLDMPLSTQALYFHLSMRADDDGFINNPRKIQRSIGATDDDLKLLIAKQFTIPFDSGVLVIKHWRLHNYIQKDRYKPTIYQDEKSQLNVESNGIYENASAPVSKSDTGCIQDVYSLDTQVRLGKDRLELGKGSIGEDITPPTPSKGDGTADVPKKKSAKPKPQKTQYAEFVSMTDDEYTSLVAKVGEQGAKRCIEILDNYKGSTGKKYSSDYRAILNWVISRYEEEQAKKPKNAVPKYEDFDPNDPYKNWN